ncbi:hypothetical protein ON010_g14807 [Phytophthora cinnamomi]|nr:hypothetical protein ON010_g14807 [Phytophthora cinnamomi]
MPNRDQIRKGKPWLALILPTSPPSSKQITARHAPAEVKGDDTMKAKVLGGDTTASWRSTWNVRDLLDIGAALSAQKPARTCLAVTLPARSAVAPGQRDQPQHKGGGAQDDYTKQWTAAMPTPTGATWRTAATPTPTGVIWGTAASISQRRATALGPRRLSLRVQVQKGGAVFDPAQDLLDAGV